MLRSAKGVSDFIYIDSGWLQQEVGITVAQVTDYMALVGDASDNIPGVPGIGEKSAAKLLQENKSLTQIYENLNAIKPAGARDKLAQHKELAFLSQKLATIRTDMPAVLQLDLATLQTPDFLNEKVQQAFRQQGYNQIYVELKKARSASMGDAANATEKTNYTLVDTLAKLEKALQKLTRQMRDNILALDTETNSLNAQSAQIIGLSLSVKERSAIYISLPLTTPTITDLFTQPDASKMTRQEAFPILKAFLQNKKLRIVGQNLKYDYAILQNWGITLPPPYFDTMIASYLCKPGIRRHNLDDLASDLLSHNTISYKELLGKHKDLTELMPEQVRDYACEDADITLRLYQVLQKRLIESNLAEVYRAIELPLMSVLLRMERVGVAIDQEYFHGLAQKYARRIENLSEEIYAMAGYELNINSTRELQKLLYEDLNLPKGRKTKTGYSTDQEALENLQGLHPIIAKILKHRKYSKLNSTYVEALPCLLAENNDPQSNRIHSSFSQTVTATGRLSSFEPNLQNIPIREETGRAIRRGFVARDAQHALISMDYSQIELRIMAHYSQDEALLAAFRAPNKRDIHCSTAASLFGVSEADVDADMRAHGKMVNFSLIYGVTEFGLARNLNIPREVAAGYIERFFVAYPGVRRYMDETIAFTQEHGYVQTLSGRIRYIPQINDDNRFRREGAERTAINTPIQGTSADIIKIAMLHIDRDIQAQKLKSRMVLQVHDELLFDVPLAEEETLRALARERMQNAMQLRVPLLVNSQRGANWDEAH